MVSFRLEFLNREKIAEGSLVVGAAFLIFSAIFLLFTTAGFFLGVGLSRTVFCMALLVTVFVLLWLSPGASFQKKCLSTLWTIGISAAVMLLSVFICSQYFDISWDGQAYHQEAIVQLVKGWNPIEHHTHTNNPQYDIVVNHYAKGPWILAASLYQWTGHMEAAKAYGLIYVLASFFISLSVLLRVVFLRSWVAWLASFVASMGPVALVQWLSFYVDGQMGSLLVVLILVVMDWALRQMNRLTIAVFVSVIVLVSNVKFTGIVFSGVMVLGLLVLQVLTRRFKDALRAAFLSGIAFVIAIFFIGYDPLVRNTIEHQHPFYPLMGKDAIDIMSYQTNRAFVGTNNFAKISISLFARSNNSVQDLPKLKIPFMFSEKEQSHFEYPDVRFGGFGPLFSGSLSLIAAIALGGVVAICFRWWRPWGSEAARRLLWWWTMVTAASLLVSLVIAGEGWWARYVPHFYMFPTVITVFGLCNYQPKLIRWISIATLFVLVLNIVLVCGAYFPHQSWATREIKKQLEEIKRSSQEMSLHVFYEKLPSSRLRLNEANIVFEESKEITCENPQTMRLSDTKFCLVPR
jgi:hypothetical protein